MFRNDQYKDAVKQGYILIANDFEQIKLLKKKIKSLTKND